MAVTQQHSTRFGRTIRHYETPDGLMPSVTQILTAIGKPALINWAANTEREMVSQAAADLYADLAPNGTKMIRPVYLATLAKRVGTVKAHTKKLREASEIGSEVHALAEWNLRRELGQVVGAEPRLTGAPAGHAFSVWETWRKSVTLTPHAVEQTVWHPHRRYAGTLDVWADLDGMPAVIDFKTAKSMYSESFLQVAAYAHALFAMGHAKPPIAGVIVRLPKIDTDPVPEVRVLPWDALQQLYPVFLAVKTLWTFLDGQEAARG